MNLLGKDYPSTEEEESHGAIVAVLLPETETNFSTTFPPHLEEFWAPTSGTAYECYKQSRKAYRKCSRQAVHDKSAQTIRLIERHFKNKKNLVVFGI